MSLKFLKDWSKGVMIALNKVSTEAEYTNFAGVFDGGAPVEAA